MKKFRVFFEETLTYSIFVDAESEEQAKEMCESNENLVEEAKFHDNFLDISNAIEIKNEK